jgi:hypothetical protein
MTIIVLTAGCSTPKHGPNPPNPLEGWSLVSQDANKQARAIRDDYQGYIQKLPAEEKKYVSDSNITFYEDGTGRHAVMIAIPLDGTRWQHFLIYDRENQRIQTVKRIGGHYAC